MQDRIGSIGLEELDEFMAALEQGDEVAAGETPNAPVAASTRSRNDVARPKNPMVSSLHSYLAIRDVRSRPPVRTRDPARSD
jgi:hypothetical protein